MLVFLGVDKSMTMRAGLRPIPSRPNPVSWCDIVNANYRPTCLTADACETVRTAYGCIANWFACDNNRLARNPQGCCKARSGVSDHATSKVCSRYRGHVIKTGQNNCLYVFIRCIPYVCDIKETLKRPLQSFAAHDHLSHITFNNFILVR